MSSKSTPRVLHHSDGWSAAAFSSSGDFGGSAHRYHGSISESLSSLRSINRRRPTAMKRYFLTLTGSGIIVGGSQATAELFGYFDIDDLLGNAFFVLFPYDLDFLKDRTTGKQRLCYVRHQDSSFFLILATTVQFHAGESLLFSVIVEPLKPTSACVLIGANDLITKVVGSTKEINAFKDCDLLQLPIGLFSGLSALSREGNSSFSARLCDQDLDVTVKNIDARNLRVIIMIDRRTSTALSSQQEWIGQYRMGDCLGEGMCGSVRQATHTALGLSVAVKTMEKSIVEGLGLPWPTLEPALLGRLAHPNIVEMYESFSVGETVYIIMECVEMELWTFLATRGCLSEDHARLYFREIVRAVSYLHHHKIAHRDLKLENLMLDHSGKLKLIDFGLAYDFSTEKYCKESCGSVDYAAPELFIDGPYDPRAVDVWALGVILYCVVAGDFPFEDVQDIIDGAYDWPEDLKVSDTMDALIFSILVRNPDLRATVESIANDQWVMENFDRPVEENLSWWEGKDIKGQLFVRFDLIALMIEQFGVPEDLALRASGTAGASDRYSAMYRMLKAKYPEPIEVNNHLVARLMKAMQGALPTHRKRSLPTLSKTHSMTNMRSSPSLNNLNLSDHEG